MSDYWRQLEDLFDELCVLDESTRRSTLDQRCNGDDRLRADVERLVSAYDQERAANAEGRMANASRRFGAWQTIRLLARGGMGEVWLAHRADGQHEQQTALKILSPYLAAADSLERFRRERQLLARLEHPNIARLLDGGMSPLGEPYLVMEYVEGIRLDRYCDQNHLSTRDRIGLMVKVCAAVQSAHQHLVLHRDLKPSNILVTSDGEPKLLDFGIAKLIDSDSTAEQTVTASLFLTAAYASPEILRGQPATVASDVYSLGVVLYEVLSGKRPFDAAKLSPAGLVEAITQSDAARPSVVCTDQSRRSDLAGDVDGIIGKALKKNPADRYESAAQLADDLRRHLGGQPVLAVEGSRWYVVRKFLRRNRLAVAAAAVLLLSLTAGLAGTLWQAHIARQERANAEQRFNDARKLANYLLFELYDSVGKVPGTMPVQAEMARRTLEYLDRLAAAKRDDPSLGVELAQGYLKLGTVFGRRLGLGDSLGNEAQAVATDRKALAVIEPLVREHPDNVEARRTLAAVEEQLGATLSVIGQYAEAFGWLQKSAETFERISDAAPRDPRSLQDAGTAWQTFGKQLSEKGGYVAFDADAPLKYLNKSVRDLETALQLDAANPATLKMLAATYESIGRIESEPNPKKGIESYTTALQLLGRLPEQERHSSQVRQLIAMMQVHLGWNQGQLGDFKTSLSNLEEARSVLDELAAADPENVGAAYRCMDVYRSLGLVEGYAGNAEKSLQYLKHAVGIMDGVVGRDTANTNYPVIRAELQGRVANLLLRAGEQAEARPYAEASVSYFKKMGESPNATAPQLIEAVRSVAETGVPALRDYSTALRFALRADQLAAGKNPVALGYLAEAYALNDDYPKAIEAAERGLAVAPRSSQGESPLRQWLKVELTQYQKKAH
jgi:tetratricopeptide (TPR) repeat protein